ncbi:MAG: sulfurtransferase TusA family protein [Candidatus Caldarchaeum sp.]|uniref:Sulfurtransferase TusA family protein n=1 Tax=Caldiarchaeum subterraneum TaxID=311458 RepID=A0A7C5L6F1_CALS0
MAQAGRRIIDSRGSFCPGPLTDLFKAYREAKNGDILELWATDPAAKSDVQAWARKTGNVVEEIVEEQGYTRIVVRVTAKSG